MESFARSWLTELCGVIPGVSRSVLLLPDPSGARPVDAARWPEGARELADLRSLAERALRERRPQADEAPPRPGAAGPALRIAVPFLTTSGALAAVALEIRDAKPTELAVWIDRVRSGAAWMGVLEARESARARVAAVLELLGVALAQGPFRAAATAVATELATRLDCERVSIGFFHRSVMRVEALSHSAHFDPRAALVRDLALAMEEACDQDAVVAWPPPPESPARVDREHERLAKSGAAAAWTVPMASDGEIIGAITFERTGGGAPDARTLRLCEDVASLLAPVLDQKRAADAPPLERARSALRRRLALAFGPDHPGVKLVATGTAALLLLLLAARGTYRVSADAALEGRVQRAIVAGIDGYIAQADARAGDVVRRGQLLGRLDDRDLLVERRKWSGQREQLEQEHREALAGHDRAQVAILDARIAQAEAQIDLLDAELARTQLVAPFEGVVVRGDLSQSLGSPVKKGDVLFEVAPSDGYRVILKVDERDIANVRAGQRGRLALSALAGETLPFAVERVTPVATSEEGRNVFRVEARVEKPTDALRPGMKGVAKIEIDRRRLLWIWSHGLVDWLRLRIWSWWS